jgi:hypothetical protein
VKLQQKNPRKNDSIKARNYFGFVFFNREIKKTPSNLKLGKK